MKALAGLASALMLAACATAQVNEGKGLSAAQDAVAAAASGVHQAYTSGVISKAQLQKADSLVDQADDLSKAARAAYSSGDASTALGAIAQINAVAVELVTMEKPQ